MENIINLKLKTVLITLLLIILTFIFGFAIIGHRLKHTSIKLTEQTKLMYALQDTLNFTKNKFNEEVASKLSIQAKLDDLNNVNLKLTVNQKELMDRIRKIQKDNSIISAALVRTEVKIDSVLFNSKVTVDEFDSTIKFTEKNDSISFTITIGNAFASSTIESPTIRFDSLMLPNKQFVEFFWENDDEYYQKPVKFRISNSNPLFKTTEVDSYIIPEVNEDAIKPKGWVRVKKIVNKKKNELMVGIGATIVGFIIGASAQ